MEILGLVYREKQGDLAILNQPIELGGSVILVPKPLLSERAVKLIQHFESLHDGDPKPNLQPKMDPVGIWTVGWGHALKDDRGRFLTGPKDKLKAYQHKLGNLTEALADVLLMNDLHIGYLPSVLKMVKRRDFNPHELGALTSFCYNCGTHYRDSKGRLKPFLLWDKVDRYVNGKELYNYWKNSVIKSQGRVLDGLKRRRKSEAWLYIHNEINFYPPDNLG